KTNNLEILDKKQKELAVDLVLTNLLGEKRKMEEINFIDVVDQFESEKGITELKFLPNHLNKIKSMNPDSFLASCKTAYLNNLRPFKFEDETIPFYKKLEQIALFFKQKEELRSFYLYLQEGQYFIDFWTAFFLIDIFDLNGTEKLMGLDENKFV